ncbi:hypothetical protein BC826DRAFT_1107124 [Russula brevipes]|nr:hypothetical protein BC826DRAFT_1107124 [Russula brevipes]
MANPNRILALYCWVLGESHTSLRVDIGDSGTVYDLIKAIQPILVPDERPALAGIGADELVLWKVSIPDENLEDEKIRRALPQNKLSSSSALSDLFPHPGPAQRSVHVVVQVPDALLPEIKFLKRELGNIPPSLLACPSTFRKVSGPGHVIACNRPFESDTIPLVLLHEAFVIFKNRCQLGPSVKAMSFLKELAPIASNWYNLEVEQRLEQRTYIHDILPGNMGPIQECKNEQRHVLNKAIVYYARFLIRALYNPLRFNNYATCFPSILIVEMGSLLGFYGAAWDGNRVRVEPLTHMYDLWNHGKEMSTTYAIASALDALMAAVDNIEAHYHSIEAEANEKPVPRKNDPRPQKARGFPFMTSYEDDGQRVTFTYSARLDVKKLVFSASLNESDFDERLVKFTGRYSDAAHHYLASCSLAPRLRWCVQLTTNWYAIIMDQSKYKVLYSLELSAADKEKVSCKVKVAVETLHQGGFVHGDLRDTNILVDLESLTSESGDVAIHILDFDTAGRTGEAKYPLLVNTSTVRRPVDVKGGELITEKHDIEMLSYLFPSI